MADRVAGHAKQPACQRGGERLRDTAVVEPAGVGQDHDADTGFRCHLEGGQEPGDRAALADEDAAALGVRLEPERHACRPGVGLEVRPEHRPDAVRSEYPSVLVRRGTPSSLTPSALHVARY